MSKLDPMTALSATATRLRRKQRECRDALTIMGGDRTTQRCIMEARMFAYSEEAERVESLIDVCRGESLLRRSTTLELSMSKLVATNEAIDGNADTLPLMPRSGLTPQR
jgi:hypothetical protein